MTTAKRLEKIYARNKEGQEKRKNAREESGHTSCCSFTGCDKPAAMSRDGKVYRHCSAQHSDAHWAQIDATAANKASSQGSPGGGH
ncbi:hypothetical protein Pelo_19198 [Pelomyxa schiedti]|nr:hypothetical protein Pelo_19198 [Pelomyxa schiedti]